MSGADCARARPERAKVLALVMRPWTAIYPFYSGCKIRWSRQETGVTGRLGIATVADF